MPIFSFPAGWIPFILTFLEINHYTAIKNLDNAGEYYPYYEKTMDWLISQLKRFFGFITQKIIYWQSFLPWHVIEEGVGFSDFFSFSGSSDHMQFMIVNFCFPTSWPTSKEREKIREETASIPNDISVISWYSKGY